MTFTITLSRSTKPYTDSEQTLCCLLSIPTKKVIHEPPEFVYKLEGIHC